MASYPTDIINPPDGDGGTYDDVNTAVLEWRVRTDPTSPLRFRIFADGRSHGQPAIDTFNWLHHT